MALNDQIYVPKKRLWYINSLLNFDKHNMSLSICPSVDIQNVDTNGGGILCLREF